MAEVKVRTITYDNLPEEVKEDPKILRFPYKKPFKEELEEFKREQDSSRGIMSTLEAKMSLLEQKKYLGGFLVPYGFKEEDILKMPLKEIEEHLQRILNYV
jgi:hypothetical protein|tara:strand:+ start:1820 stop:2122 length:303 start_codon:yes stop_codon:yes gene_type:complete